MTSREFNQDTGKAKKAAADGPVFITDRGRAAHVLLSIDEYNRLIGRSGPAKSLTDALAQRDETADFDFDPPRLRGSSLKPVDFD
jgi:prevent-host-death family protein